LIGVEHAPSEGAMRTAALESNGDTHVPGRHVATGLAHRHRPRAIREGHAVIPNLIAFGCQLRSADGVRECRRFLARKSATTLEVAEHTSLN
jgi:hypothetical protein